MQDEPIDVDAIVYDPEDQLLDAQAQAREAAAQFISKIREEEHNMLLRAINNYRRIFEDEEEPIPYEKIPREFLFRIKRLEYPQCTRFVLDYEDEDELVLMEVQEATKDNNLQYKYLIINS